MRVLIIGYNGFIGSAIVSQAVANGHTAFAMSRSASPIAEPEVVRLQADRSNPEQVLRIVKKHRIEVVVDVIPMVTSTTQPLLDCLNGLISQYIMISSSDVYANYELLHRRAIGTPLLEAATEDSPLRTSQFPYRADNPRSDIDPDRYLDDYDKIPIETAVQRLRSAWTILRLPMVYGPGDKQKRFRWAISPMLRGKQKMIIPTSWAHWRSTYGFIDNVGAAITETVGCESAFNQIFNIAEEKPVSQLAWAKKFAQALSWSGDIELSEDPDDPFNQRLNNLDLRVPFWIDGSRIRGALGISDLVDEKTAIQRTIASEE